MNHSIVITYCPGCKWLLRAGWMSQELLSTFEAQLYEVILRPGGSGEFHITLNNELIWCRKRDGGFPDAASLKKRVRDIISPDFSLGHCDRSKS